MKIALEKLNNAEIYYIISNLLGLGGLESDMIESEKLFVSYDDQYNEIAEIRFFFMSMFPIISDTMKEPETNFTIGKITNDCEIELTCGSAPMSVLDPFKNEFDAKEILQMERLSTQVLQPLRFVSGIQEITGTKQFTQRRDNNLFQSTWSQLDKSLVKSFDFGQIRTTDYSGNYFMIVKPCAEEQCANSVIEYTLMNIDFLEITTYSWPLRASMIKHYQKFGIDCFTKKKKNEVSKPL